VTISRTCRRTLTGTQDLPREALGSVGQVHRVAAMVLHATLECDLPRQDLGTYQEDGEDAGIHL
jgi:hypothetical protein